MIEAQPVKRRPGRPRKTPLVESREETAETAEPKHEDERIGTKVDDPRWTAISFPDGRQYRVEDGVIAERTV